jgi:hypothetical protein
MSANGHQLPLADANRPTASDGEPPFGGRGSAAVTGQFQTVALTSQFAGKQWSTSVGFGPILFDPSAADWLPA